MNRIAEKLALKVISRRQRHSCLILKGGRLISQASNENGKHAEQNAIHRAEYMNHCLRGATLISFRIAPGGNIGKSKPCSKCEAAINCTQIRKVIYFDGQVWREEFR